MKLEKAALPGGLFVLVAAAIPARRSTSPRFGQARDGALIEIHLFAGEGDAGLMVAREAVVAA